jgi:aspartyl-tRNA(Asn)/glutamyl-tRNA(Gln) amidotransferase subunit A
MLVRSLAEPSRRGALDRSERQASEKRVLRVGVAENAKPDAQVARLFTEVVEALRTLGHHIVTATAPFEIPDFDDLRTIDVDRQNISDKAFRHIDVLALPALTGLVLGVDQVGRNPRALSPAFTIFANYFGLPAISVPCGFDENGLPVGLQFVGKPWDDAVVLSLADQFVAANQSAQRHPIP